MHRRLSSSEKGKAIALEHIPAPRTGRVRVAEPDAPINTQKHSLTLIGRVTNPSVQKVWALIPFFTDHWKADIPPVGSDLGMGMFQFQFELESDLLTVLDKRPYHYARWMIILQRWEPTISPSFPSMIPFWVRIQGFPIHLWFEAIARSIGEDLGTFETSDITDQVFRMRVHVNGRLPLLKSSVIEYPSGDKIVATLLYEKLERHCLKCGRLDHEVRDCLEAKHEKKAMVAAQEDALRSKASVTNKDPPPRSINRPGGPTRHSPRREARFNPYSRRAPDHQTRRSYSRDPPRDMPLHSQHHSHYRQEQPRRSGTSVVNEEENYSRQPRDGHLLKRYKSPPRRDQRTASGDSQSASSTSPRPWKDERRESQ